MIVQTGGRGGGGGGGGGGGNWGNPSSNIVGLNERITFKIKIGRKRKKIRGIKNGGRRGSTLRPLRFRIFLFRIIIMIKKIKKIKKILFVSRSIYTGVALIYSSQPNNLMRSHT